MPGSEKFTISGAKLIEKVKDVIHSGTGCPGNDCRTGHRMHP